MITRRRGGGDAGVHHSTSRRRRRRQRSRALECDFVSIGLPSGSMTWMVSGSPSKKLHTPLSVFIPACPLVLLSKSLLRNDLLSNIHFSHSFLNALSIALCTAHISSTPDYLRATPQIQLRMPWTPFPHSWSRKNSKMRVRDVRSPPAVLLKTIPAKFCRKAIRRTWSCRKSQDFRQN